MRGGAFPESSGWALIESHVSFWGTLYSESSRVSFKMDSEEKSLGAGGDHITMEVDTGGTQHTPRNVSSHQSLRSPCPGLLLEGSFLRLLRQCPLWTPELWISTFLNCETMYQGGFEPPRLWQFVGKPCEPSQADVGCGEGTYCHFC